MEATSTEPRPIGSPDEAISAAFERLRGLGVRTVLDCPAGEGPLSKLLKDAGFAVTAADIFPDNFRVPGVECVRADLNDRIPLEDGRFDAVACLNGLQRVWARGRVLSEFARVLKPGGYLLLTFVNNTNLAHRLAFMLSGSIVHNTNGPPHVCEPTAEQPAAHFRYPMTVANVAAGLASVGLELEQTTSIRYSKGSLLLWPLAALPWLTRPLLPSGFQQYGHLRESSRATVLFGDYLLVIARKRTDGMNGNGAHHP